MPTARPPETSTATQIRSAVGESGCDLCGRYIEQMNATFKAVHDYIIKNRAQRAVNESYLGDLGRLIQAQVVAHRKLLQHQRTH